MAIEKFKFVSPGVQINEIDDSVIQPMPPAIGPVVIGTTSKGPLMQPVMVSSIAELERIFGVPTNGKGANGDVWRKNTPTSPTFASYAAKAFLQNSEPVTVIRLGGVEYIPGTDTADMPGWKADTVYQIHAINTTANKSLLVANIYASASITAVQVSSSAGYANAVTGTVTNNSFNLKIGSETFDISLVPTSSSFIRNVLNTDPTKYDHPDSSLTTNYFLGESYENSLWQLTSSEAYDAVYITSSSAAKVADFTQATGSVSAETGWVVDDTLVYGTYNRLFKFVGLNNGSSLAKEYKISIENVRSSKNLNVTKFGTFDVVVRSLFETQASSVIERFSNLSLDENADNYIAKKIGDSYRKWNSTSGQYEEYGSYANRSSLFRVEMGTDSFAQTALPHGFEMAKMPTFTSISGTLTSSHPDIEVLADLVSKIDAKNTRFGLVADMTNNADLVDLLHEKNFGATPGLFHTRHVSGSGNYYVYNVSTSYVNTSDDLLTAGKILGFDMPFYGGTDGKNILKQEPFVNNLILGAEEDPTKNAAYRTIKRAIDMVAQIEVLDMNLLCIPNLKNAELTNYMVETCKNRGDCMAIIDLEDDYSYGFETNNGKDDRPDSVSAVINSLQTRQMDNSYGAAYFPYVFVPSEGIFMPASIAALGAFGGTEGRSALWFAPAGFSRGGLNIATSGINVSRTALHLSSADRDALYASNINPIATFPNEGVVIFGQKTLQVTPSALDRVNVRRLVNYIKKQISRVASRVLFQPNVEATWNSFKAIVNPFLIAIKNSYGLDDAKVVLDSTTTTADLIDRNTMYCKIYIKPTRAIEYIAIDFIVTNSGAVFTE